MSSHPKDATKRLFDVMAASPHVAKQLHLPFQSGNDRVLKEMNRRYTRQQYLDLVNYAKSVKMCIRDSATPAAPDEGWTIQTPAQSGGQAPEDQTGGDASAASEGTA